LGQLIDGFNEMLEQIQKQDVALQQAHDKLEIRVEERTKDLQSEIVERRRAEAALQQQFMRISLLNQITQVISERQDLESIVRVVLRQLEDHFNLDFGGVALFDAHAQSGGPACEESSPRSKVGFARRQCIGARPHRTELVQGGTDVLSA
jgi:nitrate/nitrite-specific signal transduction histidine kinase